MSQMEILVLEKCGLYALHNSVSSDPVTARVVLMSSLDSYLRQTYPSAYQKVMEPYETLETFLKSAGREIIRAGLIKDWQNWNFEIMSSQVYIHDKRHAHHCFSELTIPKYQQEGNNSLFVFYSRDDKRRYEAERASLNRKQKKDQERVERETRENNSNSRISPPTITNVTLAENAPRRLDPLSEEIVQLCRILAPTQKTVDDVKNLRKRIQIMLNQVWPGMNYQVAIFGSSANCLALHDADVDFCIVVPESKFEQDLRHYRNRLTKQPRSVYNMFFLAARLRDIGMKSVEAIGNASVPICKFIDPQTGFQCDINTNNILGIENTAMIQRYCNLDARIRPLVFAIKQFVKQKKINNPRGGTLSSYAYVIMVLHFLMAGLSEPVIPSLQKLGNRCLGRNCNYKVSKPVSLFQEQQIIKCDARYHDCVLIRNVQTIEYDVPNIAASTVWEGRNTDSISILLAKFFQYYANLNNLVVSIITNDGELYQAGEIYTSNRCPFIVQDPFIHSKNVARSCTTVGSNIILYEFQRAARLLKEGGHQFSEICDAASNLPRPVDPDSMEYRFQQKQKVSIHKTTLTQQRYASGKQIGISHQQDKVIGYLNDNEPKKVDNNDIALLTDHTTTVTDQDAGTKKQKQKITTETIGLLEHSDLGDSSNDMIQLKEVKYQKSQVVQEIEWLTPLYMEQDQPKNANDLNLLQPTTTTVSNIQQEKPKKPQEAKDVTPILNLVKTLMASQPQEDDAESYTSNPCMDMSKLLEDPTISVNPKDICYLIAQLNFLGDALAAKILSDSLTDVVKPPCSPPTDKNNHSNSSATSAREAGLEYMGQLMSGMDLVSGNDNDEYESYDGEEEDAHGSDSEIEYGDDEEVNIEYYVHDVPEQIEGYEVYNILQWYGKISNIRFTNDIMPCWKVDMVLLYKNIGSLPTRLDFGDCIAKGFASVVN